MKISRRIYSIALIPLFLFFLGVLLSGKVVFDSNSVVKDYFEKVSKRQDLLYEIFESFGYGGGIHSFKNYVLRHDHKYKEIANSKLLNTLSLLEKYENIPDLSQTERESIPIIKRTVQEYLSKLEIAEKLILEKEEIILIDKEVKVDDDPALKAINEIQLFFRTFKADSFKEVESKSVKAIYVISIMMLLSFLLSIVLSSRISNKILTSIRNLVHISTMISNDNIHSVSEKDIHEIEETELKKLGTTLYQTANILNTTISDLKSSNEKLSNFAYAASHDLQQPAKKISMYVDLLDMEMEDISSECKSYLVEIKSSSLRMISLIKGILSYSKLGSEGVEFESLNTNEMIQKVLNLLEVDLLKIDVNLKIDKFPNVYGNQPLLVSLFQNIISNSIKYRNPDTVLEIQILKAQENEGSFRVTIIDNGKGFDSTYLATALRPFGRLNEDRGISGIGLGLSMSKKILELHKSQIEIESTEGKGTKVSFILRKI